MNTTDLTPFPPRPGIADYERQALDIMNACNQNDPGAISRIRDRWTRSVHFTDAEMLQKIRQHIAGVAGHHILENEVTANDGKLMIALEYGFADWQKFAEHIAGLNHEGSSIHQFESAVEAVINGDAATLKKLLAANPALVSARSTRLHRAMLIHYTAANGVENYRQKSPANAVEIAEILLSSGAEADAVADMYGGNSTTLGLLVSSIHPEQAGVQDELIKTLLRYGAVIDGFPTGWQPVMSALANGQMEAAETLVALGANLNNIVAAAGLGRLDIVEKMIDNKGQLIPSQPVHGVPADPKAAMAEAFTTACLYGRTEIAEFLLNKGVDITTGKNTGQTGFHLAAHGAHLDIAKMLLSRNAPLEAKNNYGGTVLGQAVWSAIHDPAADHLAFLELLLVAGADIEEGYCRACPLVGGIGCCYHNHCGPEEIIRPEIIKNIDALLRRYDNRH
jgi:ankyrin repeat protein